MRGFEGLTGFNSTLVRLKVPTIYSRLVARARFNSTLVRLKDFHVPAERGSCAGFQFHSGAVKGIVALDDVQLPEYVSIPLWCG